MDGFSYVDIFATKGIEYLLIIFYLILFVLLVGLRHRGARKPNKATEKDGRE